MFCGGELDGVIDRLLIGCELDGTVDILWTWWNCW